MDIILFKLTLSTRVTARPLIFARRVYALSASTPQFGLFGRAVSIVCIVLVIGNSLPPLDLSPLFATVGRTNSVGRLVSIGWWQMI